MASFPEYYRGWKITERATPYDHYYIAIKSGSDGIGRNKLAANTLKDLKKEIDSKQKGGL